MVLFLNYRAYLDAEVSLLGILHNLTIIECLIKLVHIGLKLHLAKDVIGVLFVV